MRFSTDGIRTTHGGNLPRPADFDALLQQGPVVTAEAAERLPDAVEYVVDRQIDAGLSVINDGEYVKAAGGGSYTGYIHERVTGWEVLPIDPAQTPQAGRRRRARPPDVPRVL